MIDEKTLNTFQITPEKLVNNITHINFHKLIDRELKKHKNIL